MAKFETIADIVSNGFCIGCGLCAAVAPSANIEMTLSSHGHLRPRLRSAISKEDNDAVLRTCPGIVVSGPFPSECADAYDPVWGRITRAAIGYAGDPELRFRASTGGAMTAINRALLRTGRVAFVLQMIPDPDNALGSTAQFARSAEELDQNNGSRYATCAPLTDIHQALELNEPFAASLKPCDVSGLKNLMEMDSRAANLIKFTTALYCGTVPSIAASYGFFSRRGVDMDRDPPATFRWRGNGCPGPTLATMSDGRQFQGTYNELWDDNTWTTQFRCKVCPDAIGLSADIAVGDNWEGGIPKGEDEGWNALVAHSDLGAAVLEEAEAAGDIVLNDVPLEHMNITQPHHMRMRQTLLARLAACKTVGMPEPTFQNLGLELCAEALSPEELGSNYAGTVERLRKGHGDGDSISDYGKSSALEGSNE